ncbi:LytR/AlgR family response regulator transcription factor [Roseateles chitosanitabidus]|jgi:DNA-binding LytR/AlgR family response regulator|uniref:LytR/AlgR family response regulator transcription factor n=1 Tax=Roseateles chitosanitabidus TaxID=65048 RepID=UPI00083480AA|nr:LytTR family DNA-binding domain-containing protein [Roseateles chitosanitabidus]MBO9686517.1 response regulator transcription factor [Roseateles chitosanitabidus]
MTTKIRTLIADDEEGPREQLRAALERLAPEIELVAASVNGVDAWDDCLAFEPQLCFLDIRMPGLSGLEVAQRLAQLAEPPQVVFVTAYGDHALSAFEAGAVDYVMKPVEDARLQQCLQRLRQRQAAVAAEPDAAPAPSMPAGTLELLRQLLPPQRGAMKPIQASQGREIQLIAPEDVLFFQSDSRYTRVVHRDGEAWIRTALKELLTDLDPQVFWQVHRSVLVNSRFISSATRVDENTMQISLKGHAEKLPVSRQFQGLFKGQ